MSAATTSVASLAMQGMNDNPLSLIASFTHSKNLMSRCRYFMLVLAVISLVVTVYIVDAPFPNESAQFNFTVGVIMLITSICGVVCAVLMFMEVNAGLRAADVTWKNMRFIDSPYLPFCMLEVAVWAVHCPPGVEHHVSNPRALNCISLFRFYIVVMLFRDLSPINAFKARSLTYFSRIRVSASLILRTQLHKSPVLTLSSVYILTAIILGTFFALAEGLTFPLGVWFIFVTSTTVGYGDVYPTTWPGRGIAGCGTMMGLLLVGFIVGAIQELLALKPDEVALFNYLDLNEYQEKLMMDSALVLQRYWRLRTKPTPLATWKLQAAMTTFREHRIRKNLAKRAVDQQESSDDTERILKAIQELTVRVDSLSRRAL